MLLLLEHSSIGNHLFFKPKETDRWIRCLKRVSSTSQSLYNIHLWCLSKRRKTPAVDYRKLNKVTIPISHPIPRLDDVFDAIGESIASIFSILDLNSANFRIELDPETRHKSPFVTHDEVYEFLHMPFCFRNAPMNFQMLMSQVLKG